MACLGHPAAAGDTVGDADELIVDALALVVLDELGEHVRLDDLSVDRRDAVHLEGADDRKVRHPHLLTRFQTSVPMPEWL